MAIRAEMKELSYKALNTHVPGDLAEFTETERKQQWLLSKGDAVAALIKGLQAYHHQELPLNSQQTGRLLRRPRQHKACRYSGLLLNRRSQSSKLQELGIRWVILIVKIVFEQKSLT